MESLRPEIGRFLRFALVGGAGFLVDAGLLAALHHGAGLDPFAARVFSIAAAALATWRLNRRLTFGPSGAGQATEALRYAMVAILNAALNYALYALALVFRPGLPPLIAVIAATLLAMAFSYFAYSRFVFSARRPAVLVSPRLHRR